MTSLGTEDSDVKPFRGSGHILTTSRSTLVRPMHKKALFRYVASQILFWCGEGLQTTTWLSYQYGGIFNRMDIHPHPRVGLFLLWTLPNSFNYQECIVSATTLWSCWLNISAASNAHIICVLVVYGPTLFVSYIRHMCLLNFSVSAPEDTKVNKNVSLQQKLAWITLLHHLVERFLKELRGEWEVSTSYRDTWLFLEMASPVLALAIWSAFVAPKLPSK